jgi:hypothetical protein
VRAHGGGGGASFVAAADVKNVADGTVVTAAALAAGNTAHLHFVPSDNPPAAR